MAKSTFLSWETTASNNTDVAGVFIGEGCPPSNMNNSDRAIMATLRRDVDGKVVYSAKGTSYTAVSDDNNAVLRFTAAATLSLTAAATLTAVTSQWHVTVIADGGDVTIDPNGAETIDGAATLIVPNGSSTYIACDGSNFFTDKMVSSLDAKADETAVGSWIDGGLLSNNSGNPNTHIDFAAMSVRSGSSFVSSASSITKHLSGTWAVGTGSGGLDAGSVAANATYYAYALRKTSDGTLDVVLSTSATIGGVTTTLLTGYTIVKQIGVVLTNGSSIIRPFTMYPRDEYQFVTPIIDAANIATTLTSALLALTVPNGVKTKVKLRFMFRSPATTNSCLVYDPAKGILVAGGADEGGVVGTPQVADGYSVGNAEIWTNTARQVRHVAGATGSLWVFNDGFYFPCGRNA
ncbi:hypothetical protein NXC12_CH00515 [Rhizobium etli]|uniref:Uncharacterized protein n=1 Tax=Rhizobium etli TaxID=29449 RepID=A0AAN1EIJ5_RHIET|nr:hypothetical protein [Rhizobium etli]ARQ08606.1 hypothetical protein NXC12_CH00515 [Rhizobium etli]